MKAEGLKYFTEAPMMVIGFLIFFVCFLGFVLWVNRRGSTDYYRRISRLPFTEPSNHKEVPDVPFQ